MSRLALPDERSRKYARGMDHPVNGAIPGFDAVYQAAHLRLISHIGLNGPDFSAILS